MIPIVIRRAGAIMKYGRYLTAQGWRRKLIPPVELTLFLFINDHLTTISIRKKLAAPKKV